MASAESESSPGAASPGAAFAGAAFAGRVIVVTGGGSGIGAACARRFAAEGATVVICGRTQSRLTATAERIGAELSRPEAVRPVVADVTDEDSVRSLVDTTLDVAGRLDGVVANAGGGGGLAPYHTQDTETFLQVLHLNVLGTMLLVKHSVPHLAADGGGSFVGMSSIAGSLTHPYFGAYGVSKAGLEQLIRTAADEYGAAGVRFNAVRPGFTSTELMSGVPRDSEVFASYEVNTPLPGVGEPADIANLVRFLLSPESRWITGQVLAVDGGHSLRRGPDYTQFVPPDRRALHPGSA